MDCILEREGQHKIRCTVCGQVERLNETVDISAVRRLHCGISMDERVARNRKGDFTLISTQAAAPDNRDCIHRGPETRRIECEECGKNVQLKVFSCAVHGECIVANKALLHSCALCPDRLDWGKKPRPNHGKPKHPSGSIYIPQPRDIQPTSPYLVLTLATEPAWPLLELTGPRMERYARRIGADFIAMRDTTQGWFMLEKLRVREYLPHYERVIYLDADVVVAEDCPSLFDVVTKGMIGMHDDWPPLSQWGEYFIKEWESLMASQGVGRPFQNHAHNTGVICVDREHLGMYDPPKRPLPECWCDEQSWEQSNVALYGYPVFPLPSEYNCQYWETKYKSIAEYEEAARKAHIAHVSGCPDNVRMELIRRLLRTP